MHIPFQVIDWEKVPTTSHTGESCFSTWQTMNIENIRLRLVNYPAGYLADHWCQKGHIVYCLEGEFTTALEGGESFTLRQGMSYIVSDNLSSHRSVAQKDTRLLIIDGDFLH